MLRKEIGDKKGEATDYGNLGTVFQSVGQCTKGEEYLQKALVIKKEIRDKKRDWFPDFRNLMPGPVYLIFCNQKMFIYYSLSMHEKFLQ